MIGEKLKVKGIPTTKDILEQVDKFRRENGLPKLPSKIHRGNLPQI